MEEMKRQRNKSPKVTTTEVKQVPLHEGSSRGPYLSFQATNGKMKVGACESGAPGMMLNGM